MSDWKEHTATAIPELDGMDELHDPIALWIELHLLLGKAIENGNESLVARIAGEFRYYLFNEDDADSALFTGVVIGLMEHLMAIKDIENYIGLFLSRDEFLEFREPLTRHSRRKYNQILETVYAK